METVLISLLFKLAPYIIAVLGVLGLYFGIKQRGVRQERERQAEREVEAKKQTEDKVNRAVAKDEVVDERTAERVKKIEAENTVGSDTPDKFRF